MSFRVSFILLVLVAVVGGYVALFELQKKPEAAKEAPWFYNVSFSEIRDITIEYLGVNERFQLVNDVWVFQDTQEPVDLERWSGIPFLLTGPRSTRQVRDVVEDPAEYGLDVPQTRIHVTLNSGRRIDVNLGKATPDGSSVYAQVSDSQGLFLLPASWADVMNRLVTEPPVLAPTPTPTAAATPTPAEAATPAA